MTFLRHAYSLDPPLTPFPPYLYPDTGRTRRALPAPPWADTDRGCGTVGRVWIDTN